MELNINLLAPQKKTKLTKMVNFLFVKNILELTIFTFAVIAVALLWNWLILQEEFSNLAQSSMLVSRNHSSYNKEIREINRVIRDLTASSREFTVLSDKLLEIAASLPPDIKLNAVSINRRDNTFSVSGVAATRGGLLNYQTILNQMTWTEPVSTPSSQLFQKENINFQFTGKLKGVLPVKKDTAPKPAAAAND